MLIISTTVIVVYLLFFKFVVHRSGCISKLIFGFPCPGCGLTRSFESLFSLDIKKAFFYHPLFLTIPFIVFLLIFHEVKPLDRIYKSKIFWIIIFMAFFICYIIRMCIYFPNDPMNLAVGIVQLLFK